MLLQVGVKALIKNSAGKYLLLKRNKTMDGETNVSWDIPGGRIEPNENLHEALIRELNEEIGLTTLPEPHLIAAQDIFVKNKDLHVVRLTYKVSCNLEEVKLSDEHSDYRWVAPADIKSMPTEPYLSEVLAGFALD